MKRNGISLKDCDIRGCDEILVENGYVNATYELWFDVEKFFDVKLSDSEWINLYTNWYPDGRFEILVYIDSDDGGRELPFEFDEEEIDVFKKLMESYCQATTNCSLAGCYLIYG